MKYKIKFVILKSIAQWTKYYSEFSSALSYCSDFNAHVAATLMSKIK